MREIDTPEALKNHRQEYLIEAWGLFSHNLYLGQLIPPAGVAHQNNTCRFGDDPQASV